MDRNPMPLTRRPPRLGRRLLGLLAVLGLAVAAAPERPAAPMPVEVQKRKRGPEYSAYLKLPPEARARLKQLDRHVQQQPEPRKSQLLAVMRQYREWLEQLRPEQRRQIEEAPTSAAKLDLIRRLREEQWIASLPAAQQREIQTAKTPDARAQVIARIRQEWQVWEDEWRNRDHEELDLPVNEEEEVARWVRDKLNPKLSRNESQRATELALRTRLELQYSAFLVLGRWPEVGVSGGLPLAAALPPQLGFVQRKNARPAYFRTLIDYANKYEVDLPEPLKRIPPSSPLLGDQKLYALLRRWPVAHEREAFLTRYMDVKQREALRREVLELLRTQYPHELRRLQGGNKRVTPGKPVN